MCDFSEKKITQHKPPPQKYFFGELLIHAENAIEKNCQINIKGIFLIKM